MKLFYKQAHEAIQPYLLKNRSAQKCFSCFVLFIFSFCLRDATNAQTAPPIQWQKCLGGSSDDWANSIQQTTDGGFIVAGYSISNDSDVSGNHGGRDYWIVKLDSIGNLAWQKAYGGTDNDQANSIQQTTDGGFIVAGNSGSNDGDVTGHHGATGVFGYSDYWIVKLDAAGNIVWQKSLGGTFPDYANSIQQVTDGGFIVAGITQSTDGDVSGNHGNADYWIVKLDANGNLIWQKCLGGSSYDDAYSIQQTADGGFIVAGYSKSKNGEVSGHHGTTSFSDYWIVKLDVNGNIVWQKSFGGINNDYAYSIQQTVDGGFIVVGYSYSNDGDVSGNHGNNDYWIVKLDANGNLAWQKCLGGSEYEEAYSIQQTTDGGFIVAGNSLSNDGDVSGNHGGVYYGDYWIVKLAPDGQPCLSPSNLSVTNVTATSAQLNWNIEGTPDQFRISYHTQDGPIQIKRVSGTASSVTLSNLIPATIYSWNITAKCSSDLQSSPTPGKRFTTSSNKEDQAATSTQSFNLYPNPSAGSFTINLQTGEAITNSATIQILNAFGQTIYAQEGMIENGVLQKEIQLNDAAPGMYLVKATSSDRVYTSQINLQR